MLSSEIIDLGPEPPSALRLSEDGELQHDGQRVSVSRSFPWSHPESFFSLRNAKNEEVALIKGLEDLDAASRAALETALQSSCFVLEIVGLESVVEEYELRTWVVRLVQGKRVFQTRLDDWPFRMPGAEAILIQDVWGDIYQVKDLAALDPKSRQILSPFVD